MKNRVKFLVTELLVPVERREILSYEIATVVTEVPEITRAKIIDHGETRVWEFFLQGEREIRTDETGAAGDDQV
jgi:hypothetical protein